MKDSERLSHAFHRCAREVIVGADDREVRRLKHRGKGIQSVVKLMVTKRSGIVAHSVHGVEFDTAVIEIEIGCALTEVAGIFFAPL